MFDADSFRLIGADFLGLRTNQLLIAVLNTQSNGMGVEYWSLWFVTRDQISRPLEVNDFGVMSFLTASPAGKCEIFAARWRDGWEPKRGSGLYIAGHWRQISLHGDISIDWDRPVLYRRYLFDLERQRNGAMSESGRRAVPWHTSPLARRVIGPYPTER